jgi:endonuclease/exonuclease/phosphatase family metal-dependent hydrolase
LFQYLFTGQLQIGAMISVASYNIQKSIGTDFRRRPERIFGVLNELDADVIALQEVDRRFGERVSSLSPEAIAEHTHYEPLRFGVRSGSLGWHGNTILVRKGTKILAQTALTLPVLEPRGAVMADLLIGNTALRIVGMHLGLLGLWRRRQALALLDQLQALETQLPTVMMGDLNEWSVNGGCLAHFSENHHVAEPGPSFPSPRPTMGFDRIITSPDLVITNTGVHRTDMARKASDHLPVWARINPA